MAWSEEYKIYVGGLSWYTLEPKLVDAFSRFGKIFDSRIIIDRFLGRSRGYGFITFASRRGMDNAIREMNGQELDQVIITVDKASFRMKGEYVEEGSSRGYLSGGRVSFRRGDRSMVHGECFECGSLGHWVRDCPLAGRHRHSFSSRSRFERDDSEDYFGEDRDRYVDEQYDGGQHRVMDHFGSEHDENGC